VKRVGGIDYISPAITGRTTVKYKKDEITSSIMGIEPDVFTNIAGTLEIEDGRFLAGTDRKSVVIGGNIAKERFDEDVGVSSVLYISGERYTVVGVLKKTGTSFTNFDDVIFMPFDEAQSMFSGTMAKDEITAIRLTVKEGEDADAIADEINVILLAAHHVTEDEKDFSVITATFINERLNEVTGILSIFMGAIAGISLIVGGVGISNTMFMAVLERTREIGVLKAIGATEWEIQTLFLVESSLIGFLGGFAGLCVAFVLILLISSLAGIPAVFIPWVAVGALLFSAAVGIAAGVFPARQASRLDAIEALRYE
ncbi:ABC transporter permease, partial [Candidatus Micrarchaeota archaeon]|nr:ABC transporter permease [Candidatus Micrarchaeota archaeon]